jgi:predicted nucleic acid-binding protein
VIVLDTNVISELMRAEPHPAVLNWVATQPPALMYTTYINQAEILYGIRALPEGRRRMALAEAAEAVTTATAIPSTAYRDDEPADRLLAGRAGVVGDGRRRRRGAEHRWSVQSRDQWQLQRREKFEL